MTRIIAHGVFVAHIFVHPSHAPRTYFLVVPMLFFPPHYYTFLSLPAAMQPLLSCTSRPTITFWTISVRPGFAYAVAKAVVFALGGPVFSLPSKACLPPLSCPSYICACSLSLRCAWMHALRVSTTCMSLLGPHSITCPWI